MNPAELKGALEAIIYAADEPATLDQIVNAVGEEKHIVRAALDEMIATYAARIAASKFAPLRAATSSTPSRSTTTSCADSSRACALRCD